MQALDNLGLSSAELADWNVTLAENSIRMQGELSTDAQRRVFSLIELPAVEMKEGEATVGPDGTSKPASESEARDRSLAYFKSTQVLLDDLKKGLKDTKATSAWMERYARKIDELPVLHVDELLLDYGDKLAETLRVMSLSKARGGNPLRRACHRRRRVLRRLLLRGERLHRRGGSFASSQRGNGGRLGHEGTRLEADRRRVGGHSPDADQEVWGRILIRVRAW